MKLSPDVRIVSTPMLFRNLSVSGVLSLTDTIRRSMFEEAEIASTTL